MSRFRKLVEHILQEKKSFFANSGIIEANYAWQYDFKNGKPVTVEGYHSTPHKFTKFKIGPVNVWGKGVYLTTNYKQNSYNPDSTQDWNHMRLYATFFKPFIYEEHISENTRNFFIDEIEKTISKEDLETINNKFQSLENYFDLIFKNLARTQYSKHSSLTVTNLIQQLDEKHNLNIWKNLDIDGMILPFLKAFGESSDKDMEKTVWYVCYKPNQIKLYENNNGNYDLDKDDIYESVENKLPNINSLNDNQSFIAESSSYTIDNIKIHEDPSVRWMRNQLDKRIELRVLIDGDLNEPYFGSWTVWNAYDANHNTMLKMLGLNEDDYIQLKLKPDDVMLWGYTKDQIKRLKECDKLNELYPDGYDLLEEW